MSSRSLIGEAGCDHHHEGYREGQSDQKLGAHQSGRNFAFCVQASARPLAIATPPSGSMIQVATMDMAG
jgi:hypothetical protein